MIEFIQNPWTIGIGAGVISGLIVFLLTGKFFSRKENKEYLQRLSSANNELLYAIRPLVVSKQIPQKNIIEALVVATARKFNVKDSDLFNNKNIADFLIKEILDNPFLDSDSKINYCNLVENMRKNEESALEELKREIIYIEKNKTASSEISVILAIMTMVTVGMTVIMALYNDLDRINNVLPFVIIASALIPIIALLVKKILKIFKKEREQKRKLEN